MTSTNRDNEMKLRSGVQRNLANAPLDGDDADIAKKRQRKSSSSLIYRIEEIHCPPRCFRKDKEGIALITGLERVLYGTQAAADVVTILGVRPPRYPFYMVSGFLCDLIQFVVDVCLHSFLNLQDPSLCWALGFGISIAFRHTSHRYIVFGNYVGGYWYSLGRMYAGYSIIIVISTIFNIVMTRKLELQHYVAWVITLLWTGIVNYFILKKLWTFGKKDDSDKDEKIDDPENPKLATL